MQLTLKPTEQFFMAGDVMVRMWTGADEHGRPVVALIAGVGLSDGSPRAPLMAERLVPIPPPDAAAAQRWAQEVMRRGGLGS